MNFAVWSPPNVPSPVYFESKTFCNIPKGGASCRWPGGSELLGIRKASESAIADLSRMVVKVFHRDSLN